MALALLWMHENKLIAPTRLCDEPAPRCKSAASTQTLVVFLLSAYYRLSTQYLRSGLLNSLTHDAVDSRDHR